MPVSNRSMLGITPIPRYVQLSELLRQRLDEGVWATGAVLPSIEQLMVEFDSARVTVRQAIALLAAEGLLSPQRGRGTYVTEKAGKLRQLRVETTLGELVAMYTGDKPDHKTLEDGIATPHLLEADGVSAPKYFHMRRVHSRDGDPYCVISIFMDHRIFRRAPARFRKELVLPVLTSLPGLRIKSGRQSLSIAKADAEVSRLLGITIGAPIANVRRLLCSEDGTVIYLAEVKYRGDFVHLEMDLKP